MTEAFIDAIALVQAAHRLIERGQYPHARYALRQAIHLVDPRHAVDLADDPESTPEALEARAD